MRRLGNSGDGVPCLVGAPWIAFAAVRLLVITIMAPTLHTTSSTSWAFQPNPSFFTKSPQRSKEHPSYLSKIDTARRLRLLEMSSSSSTVATSQPPSGEESSWPASSVDSLLFLGDNADDNASAILRPQQSENDASSEPSPEPRTLSVYVQLLHQIASSMKNVEKGGTDPEVALQGAERLLQHLKERSVSRPDLRPTTAVYNQIIRIWSNSGQGTKASDRCLELLKELWAYHKDTHDLRCLPDQTTYLGTLTALAQSRGGRLAAEQAEALLEDMEKVRATHPSLGPTTRCINLVL